MISKNLLNLRKMNGYSQEEVASRIGVSRQTLAKWENGESVPDVMFSSKLAEIYDVSLDDLVNFDSEQMDVQIMSPKGKYLFGTVTVGERGQIVIPKKARRIFDIKPGDDLLLLGDIEQGLALTKTDFFMEVVNQIQGKGKK